MWDWEFVALRAVIGALASALGWIATRRLRQTRKDGARNIQVAFVVLGVVLGGQLLRPMLETRKMRRELLAVSLETYGNAGTAALNVETLEPILRSPKLKARLATVKGAKGPGGTGVAELTAAGMARLDGTDLDAIFGVKRALADLSPEVCAGLWTGRVSANDFAEGLRKLTEEQQRIWITVSGRALSREIEAVGEPPRIARAAKDRAMGDLVTALTPEERASFVEAAQSTAPTPREACQAFRALADGLKALPPADRELVMRAINNPALLQLWRAFSARPLLRCVQFAQVRAHRDARCRPRRLAVAACVALRYRLEQ